MSEFRNNVIRGVVESPDFEGAYTTITNGMDSWWADRRYIPEAASRLGLRPRNADINIVGSPQLDMPPDLVRECGLDDLAACARSAGVIVLPSGRNFVPAISYLQSVGCDPPETFPKRRYTVRSAGQTYRCLRNASIIDAVERGRGEGDFGIVGLDMYANSFTSLRFDPIADMTSELVLATIKDPAELMSRLEARDKVNVVTKYGLWLQRLVRFEPWSWSLQVRGVKGCTEDYLRFADCIAEIADSRASLKAYNATEIMVLSGMKLGAVRRCLLGTKYDPACATEINSKI